MRARALVLALVLGGLLAFPSLALGHALLLSSEPAAGTSAPVPPSIVTLTFSERPEPSLSRVRVLDASGEDHASGPVEAVTGSPDQLRIPLGTLGDGVYTVSWRTVSAVDGHASAGTFAFGVGGTTVVTPPEGPGPAAPPAAWPLAIVARWLLYLGLGAVLGSALVGGLLHPRPPRRLVWLAVGGTVATIVGTVGIVSYQWLESGVALGTFAASALGLAALARLATVAVVGGGAAALWRTGPPGLAGGRARTAYGITGAAAMVAFIVEVATGHAAAGDRPIVSMAVQAVHGLGALAWIGGLAALLVAIVGLPTDEKTMAVKRYSMAAGVILAVVALSGLARAVDQIGSIGALVGSDFGRLAIAKSAGLLALAGFGATNRFVNVPAVARSLAGLRRTGALEVAAGAGVLLLTAALVNAVPPASAGPSPEPDSGSLVAQGHDFGTSVRVRLEVTPGRAGSNDFGATVNDFDSGAPVVATSVSLRFSLVSSTAVPPSRLDLTATPSGAFAGSGGNLGLDGIWRITAVVTTDEGAVEVPLVVATRVPALTVTSDPSIEPIIYTVQLPDVGSVQLYLDPGRVGSNGLHVTFFDTAGTGLPVSRIALAVLRPDGSGELLDARALEPGHFVGSVELDQAVPVRVDVAGVAPDGASFHVSLEMEVSA